MPDKDFDSLFKDKFMDAEIEPSAGLWLKIEEQLEPKKKKVIPIYWYAAASIAIAFTAFSLFQKEEKIRLYGADVVTTQPAIQSTEKMSVNPAMEEQTTGVQYSTKRLIAKVEGVSKVQSTMIVSENNSKKIEEAMQPNESFAHLPIKQSEPKAITMLPTTIIEAPVVLAHADTKPLVEDHIIDEMDSSVEKKGIRNVGDLVNYVVDKVDKREKKLLRFNTDDDDNSSIVGINIGFLKLNKKNK